MPNLFLIETALIILISVMVVALSLLGYFIYHYQRNVTKSQSKVVDIEILELLHQQVDGMLTIQQLTNLTDLTKAEARSRMTSLVTNGLVRMNYTATMKGYYRLVQPLDQRPGPELSKEPFLTVQDILQLFKHYNFNPSLQDLLVATRLPVKVIMREMKYFQKEKIVTMLYSSTDGMGTTYGSRSFVLQEPYRTNPDQFLAREMELNREVKETLVKESLLV